jgi:hypothetical protein
LRGQEEALVVVWVGWQSRDAVEPEKVQVVVAAAAAAVAAEAMK